MCLGRPLRTAVVACGLTLAAGSAKAQYVESFFSPIVPGFDKQQGVTVLSRLRPLYQQPGVRLGSFTLNGSLDEQIGYDSNITGVNNGPSSGLVRTTPQISGASDWSRNRLGFSVGADNYSYFSAPNENYTNYNVSLGGGYTLGRHDLNLGYSHLRQHEMGTDVAAIVTTTPIAYDVDVVRGDYTMESGRFSFIPNFDMRLYQFGNGTLDNQITNQQFRDRTVLAGGITTRFSISDQRSLLLVVQGSSSHYVHPQPGFTNNDSKTVLLLGGIDYQAVGPWRYRLLAGAELRQFASSQYPTRVAPVVTADAIWTPTELTTVTATIRREIEDLQTEGTGGYTYSTGQLVVDHELRRNILLQGRGTLQAANYLQNGGSSTSYTLGAGVNWLVNRRIRLSADYDYTHQHGSSNGAVVSVGPTSALLVAGIAGTPTTVTTGTYTHNVLLFGIHLGL